MPKPRIGLEVEVGVAEGRVVEEGIESVEVDEGDEVTGNETEKKHDYIHKYNIKGIFYFVPISRLGQKSKI